VIGRLGGDEFDTLLTGTDKEEADEVLARFAVAIEEANATLNKPYKIEYSLGLVHFQHNTKQSAEEMIQEADAAMYKHKKSKIR
jgi:diguanylate cyclase (GGDEF)-like protein